jgi:pimeloyl-ACP methyl ester carboxylesterase
MPENPIKFAAKDFASFLRLAASGTIVTSRMVEDLQRQIDAPWRSSLLKNTSAFALRIGVTGLVHRSIRAIAAGVGALAAVSEAKLQGADSSFVLSENRVRFLSIINGVMGDQLAANQHAWALEMQLMEPLISGEITKQNKGTALFIHGLCMSDLDWQAGAHPQALEAMGYRCMYVRYNTGLPIAENGARLSALLQQYMATNSGELVCIAHSMGGLVLRSALDQPVRKNASWIRKLTACVYLGTPHAGAPLEHIGRTVSSLWQRLPLLGALAPIASLRSQGIQDLALGVALPFSSACRHLLVAGTLSKTSSKSAQAIGDGLVPVASALAQNQSTLHTSFVKRVSLQGLGHLALLRDDRVTQSLVDFLAMSLAKAPAPQYT